jgi:hypothetical protein
MKFSLLIFKNPYLIFEFLIPYLIFTLTWAIIYIYIYIYFPGRQLENHRVLGSMIDHLYLPLPVNRSIRKDLSKKKKKKKKRS